MPDFRWIYVVEGEKSGFLVTCGLIFEIVNRALGGKDDAKMERAYWFNQPGRLLWLDPSNFPLDLFEVDLGNHAPFH